MATLVLKTSDTSYKTVGSATTINSRYKEYIQIKYNSASTANCTTNISVRLQLELTATETYDAYNSYDQDTAIYVDGGKKSGTFADFDFIGKAVGTTKTVMSWTGNVSNDDDGSKTITLCAFHATSIFGNQYVPDASNLTDAKNKAYTVDLPTIPRASSISSVTSSVAAGSAVTVNISRASSSFTHTVDITFGSYSKSITGVATSTSYTIPLTWCSNILSATSGTATVTVTTKSGSTTIGSSVSKTFTITVPSSVVPSVSLSISTTDWNGIYVIGKGLKSTLSATAANYTSGSTDITSISSTKIVCTAMSFSVTGTSSASGTSASYTVAGTYTYTATVTDKRGRTATATKSATFVDYVSPTCTASAYRSDASGNQTTYGPYVSVLVSGSVGSGLGGTNTLTISGATLAGTSLTAVSSGLYVSASTYDPFAAVAFTGTAADTYGTSTVSSGNLADVAKPSPSFVSGPTATCGASGASLSASFGNNTDASSGATVSYNWSATLETKTQTGTGNSVSTAASTEWYSVIPNSTSKSGAMSVTLIINGYAANSVTQAFTITVPDYNPTVGAPTGVSGATNTFGAYYLTGRSTFSHQWTHTPKWGATVKSFSAVVSGATVTSTVSGNTVTTTTGIFSTAGSKVVSLTLTDSRDRTVTVNAASVLLTIYAEPSAQISAVSRCDSLGVEAVGEKGVLIKFKKNSYTSLTGNNFTATYTINLSSSVTITGGFVLNPDGTVKQVTSNGTTSSVSSTVTGGTTTLICTVSGTTITAAIIDDAQLIADSSYLSSATYFDAVSSTSVKNLSFTVPAPSFPLDFVISSGKVQGASFGEPAITGFFKSIWNLLIKKDTPEIYFTDNQNKTVILRKKNNVAALYFYDGTTEKALSLDGHTHTALDSSVNIGSASQPIFIQNGVMTASTYALSDFVSMAGATGASDPHVIKVGWSGTQLIFDVDSGTTVQSFSLSNHTHNYAGSSSAGGDATSAVKLSTARTLTIGSKDKTFNGTGNVSWSLSEIGAFPSAGGTISGATAIQGALSITGEFYFTAALTGSSADVYINNATRQLKLTNDALYMAFADASGAVTLGTSTRLWGQIYSSKSTISTSDRNKKKNIVDIGELYEELFIKLIPSVYDYIDGDRRHTGFISQDVEAAMSEVGLSDTDFGAFCKDIRTKSADKYVTKTRLENCPETLRCIETDEDGNEIIVEREVMVQKEVEYQEREENDIPDLDEDGNYQYNYSLRYEEFIALNTHMIQKNMQEIKTLRENLVAANDKISSLEERLAALEARLSS